MANQDVQKTIHPNLNEITLSKKEAGQVGAKTKELREKCEVALTLLKRNLTQKAEKAAVPAAPKEEEKTAAPQPVLRTSSVPEHKPHEQQGTRPAYQPRTYNNQGQQSGYQPNRTYPPRSQQNGAGYQGQQNRPPYNAGAPRPQGTGYQGYQGQQGNRPPYNPGAPRPQGTGYQGNRPYNTASGGGFSRPQGTGYQGNRPYNTTGGGGFSRPPMAGGFRSGANSINNDNKRRTDKPMLESASVLMRSARDFGNKNKGKSSSNQVEEKRNLRKEMMRKGSFTDENGEERMGSRKLKMKKLFEAPKQAELITNAVITTDHLTVKQLSETISRPANEIVKKLFLLGMMMTINSKIDYDTAELVASELGVTLTKKLGKTFEEKVTELHTDSDPEDQKQKRPPIVTVMGHVDHGKTSLLDALRKTNVVTSESGGITQHIGAYTVTASNGELITFIDTPGHAAFSAMRARGAKVTDVAILVVAADDGIMPQTVEAIKHIQEANVSMIVAINKMDKQDANPDKIKQQLTEYNVVAEEWGGDAVIVPISAKTGKGIDKLLEMVVLVSEIKNLKANPHRKAVGTVLEARLDKTKGALATILIENGTLKTGDVIIAGTTYGKIRIMENDKGAVIKAAGPSVPVLVLGLDDVPKAGDHFYAVEAHLSKQVIEERKNIIKEQRIRQTAVSTDEFFAKVDEGKLKPLNLIIKSDVQGSAEALKHSLLELTNDEVKVNILSASAGNINERDLLIAGPAKAIVIAFNLKIDAKTESLAKKNQVEIKSYKIIYQAVDFIKEKIKAMETPKFEEKFVGRAKVLLVFKLSSHGVVAGSMITEGKMIRNAKARIIRKGEEVAVGNIESLKIGKEDQKEVAKDFECGIKISGCADYKEDDIVECFTLERI